MARMGHSDDIDLAFHTLVQELDLFLKVGGRSRIAWNEENLRS